MADGFEAGIRQKSRRSHRKSRNGCGNCKRRKVKVRRALVPLAEQPHLTRKQPQCDEHRPWCRNCARHGVTCSFADESPSSTPSQQLGNGAGGEGELSMPALELMHHYTTSTHATLSSDPDVRSLWRGPVVTLALACPYLMRSLLALSALHLAYHRPDERDRYVRVAMEYHQLAVQQAAPLVSNLSRAEAEHLFIFSVFTFIFCWFFSSFFPLPSGLLLALMPPSPGELQRVARRFPLLRRGQLPRLALPLRRVQVSCRHHNGGL